MKQYRLALFITFVIVVLLATTQAFASPANIPLAKNTPGAKATEKADDKATKQAGKQHGKHEHFKGIVSAVDSSSITLTLRDGSSITVSLSADTQMKFPGPKDTAPASIQPGMKVMVQGIRDQGGNLIAVRIMAIPGKPAKAHRVGIVTEYTAGESITIQDKKGNTYSFALSPETRLLPAERAETLGVGSFVTIIAPRDPSNSEMTAKGIVIHPPKP
ncbi:MAG TPA: DUF5666 domain-containing protein [Anaerolineales bacterium]|nr:DUF5666 domain-containing protein [Anaerolineales bacterium]